jgi:hypothetical protein
MILKKQKDFQKANSLSKIADETNERLYTTDIFKYPSTSLKDYYDIIHSLLEALTTIFGAKVIGENSHLELINFICKECKLTEKERIFMQNLRMKRNSLSYEGVSIDKTYLENNQKEIEQTITRLKKLVAEKLR